MKFSNKYKVLAENFITRYQSGGLLTGDIVKIRKDAFKNGKVNILSDDYKSQIRHAMETDLNLRVSAIKSIRPNSTGNYADSTDAPTDFFVDIVIEYAPGLWRNPLTLPIEVLERVDTGANLAPVPDSVKRKSDIHGPKEIGDIKNPIKIDKNAKKDTKLANTKDPKDGRDGLTKPEEDKKDYSGKPKKLAEESIESLYENILVENKK